MYLSIKSIIVEYDRNWHALIQAHPYLYFE
nr:MAG TPA: hypothetical protein [Caudoviricetes sp.]